MISEMSAFSSGILRSILSNLFPDLNYYFSSLGPKQKNSTFIALILYCHSLCCGGKPIYKNTPPLIYFWLSSLFRGARRSIGQCPRRAIVEAKHRSQWPVLGWVIKINYLELLRASEGTISRWSRLHLQSLPPTPVSRRFDIRQAAGRKNNCRIFITTWRQNFLYRPHLVG
jgi:hypothetical protein